MLGSKYDKRTEDQCSKNENAKVNEQGDQRKEKRKKELL